MPRVSRMTLAAAIAALLAFAAPAQAADGDLDPAFGGDGIADFGQDVLETQTGLQPDGKIIAAGPSPAGGVWVARFHPSGELDTAFGQAGYVRTDSQLSLLTALAIQPDGRIVLAGHPDLHAEGADVVVSRLLPDGGDDPAFGEAGVARFDFEGTQFSVASDVVVLSNGRILVSGTAENSDFAVARLTSAGLLDEAFSDNGLVTADVGGDVESVRAMTVQGGRIVLVGTTNGQRSQDPEGSHVAVLGLTASGSRDAGFGDDGVVRVAPGRSAIDAIRTQDGHVLIAGSIGEGASDWWFLKLDAFGEPAAGFGNGGELVLDLGEPSGDARSLTTTIDGAVAALGLHDRTVAIAKFTLRGAPVTSFGDGGRRIYNLSRNVAGRSILRQPDGKLLAGLSFDDYDGALMRVQDSGSTDPVPQPPLLELTAGSAVEGQILPFTATLSRPSDQPVTFNYVTGEGTAANDRDFGTRSGTVTIPAGQTSATIGIPTNADRLFETEEIFRVELSGAVNARLGEYVAFGTILNDLRSGRCQNIVRGRGKGTDILTGSSAGDRLDGLQDIDFLFGLGGADCLYGHRGGDIMDGGDGDDIVDGGSGDDRMKGGDGQDRLYGRRGRNRYNGGNGNDRIYARNGVAEIVECGPGRDTVKADRRDRLRRCEIVTR